MTRRADIDSSTRQPAQRGEVVVERGRAPARSRRRAQHVGGDERVAVAVAADPRAHAHGAGGVDVDRPSARRRGARGRARAPGTTSNRLARVVAQRLVDLVGDAQLGQPQHRGLPQRQDEHAEAVVELVAGRACPARPSVRAASSAGDVAEHVEHGLAADLGRVGGDHGHDEQVVDEAGGSPSASTPAGDEVVERRRDAADLRPRAVARGGSGGAARGGRPRPCWPAATASRTPG